MKHLKTLFTLLFLVLTTAAFAQSKTLSKANKFYKQKQYAEAIPLYEKSLEEKNSVPVQTKLAFCYKSVNQINKAEKLYSDIVYADKPRPITFYYYGETLMRNGKYAAAKFWFEEYLKKKPGDPNSIRMIESCDKVNMIKPYFGYVEATPFSMNSESDDNAGVMLGDQLVFCSDRKQKSKLLKQKSGVTGRDFINIYQSQKQADGTFTEPVSFSSKINGLNKNTGPITFDATGAFAVFSRNSDIANTKDAYPLALYQTVMGEGKWKNIEMISFCRPEANYMHPALSPDGKKLFFISDKAGGNGGTELYLSERKTDGSWGRPVNLGEVVNTDGHEGFPFYDQEGRLFFSSKGHIGFGGYDVFFTTQEENGNWTKPTNVGFPINSSADDISIFVNADGKSGLFTSGRSGTSDDIYLFQSAEEGAATPVALNEPEVSKPIIETVTTPEPAIIEPTQPEESMVETSIVETIEEVVPEMPELMEKSPSIESNVEVSSATPPEMEIIESTEVETIVAAPETIIEETFVEETFPEESVVAAVPEIQSEEVETDINSTASLTEMIAEMESTPRVETMEVPETPSVVDAVVESTEVDPTLPEMEIPTTPEAPVSAEIITEVEATPAESSLTEMIAEMETPVENPETIVPTEEVIETVESVTNSEAGSSTIVEPARLNTNPEMVEETLMIEEKDQAMTVTLAPGSALTEFDGDLASKNISVEKAYRIPNVDYDFNSTDLSLELMVALDEVVRILTANPNIEIQLIGHTASFGNNSKNQELSESRAQIAASYLMDKGIARHRVNHTGYGETQLLNECVDGILCSMDQHKMNERLEVKVVRY